MSKKRAFSKALSLKRLKKKIDKKPNIEPKNKENNKNPLSFKFKIYQNLRAEKFIKILTLKVYTELFGVNEIYLKFSNNKND